MNSRSLAHPMFLGLWLLAAAVGYFFLLQHKGNPGGAGGPPELWPPDSLVSLDSRRPTLVMLAHSFLTLETLRNKKNFWVDPAEDAS